MNKKETSKEKKNLFSISNIISAILLLFVAGMLFSSDFKGKVMGGLMKIGLFQPSIPENRELKIPENLKNISSFKVSDPKGNSFSLNDLKGKVVFINFWATWCPPCKAEMPTINKLYKKFKTNDLVVFLMIDTDYQNGKSIKYMEDMKFDLPVHFPASEIPAELMAGSLPTTVILDHEGNIYFKHEGMADFSNAKFIDFFEKLVYEK